MVDAGMKIAIDPGANGGIAVEFCGLVECWKMPETIGDIWDLFLSQFAGAETECIIEAAGMHVAGNNASASCKFARHCGHLEMALIAAGIPFKSIHPTKWMKHLGQMPKNKAERKRYIKDLMQRRYPAIDVTRWNADALGILTYMLEGGK